MQITHPFVSGKADGGDATLVRPSNWNAAHTIAGFTNIYTPQQYNGSAGDGVTDSSSAIQQALDAAGSGAGSVFLPRGTYIVSSQLTIPDSVIVMGESTHETVIYQAASGTAINGVFRVDGATSLATTISGTVTIGDRTITLANVSSYAIGDLIEIRTIESGVQAADPANHNAHTLLTRIMDIAGSTIVLLDPIPFGIGASDDEAVVKVTPKRVQIHNLTLNGVNNVGQAPYGNNAIVLFFTQNVVLRNINTENYQKGYGVFLWSSYGSRVDSYYSQNAGDEVGFGAAFGTFDCTRCTFNDITTIWPSRDGIPFVRNSLCSYTNLTSVRAKVRNVKFHGCRQCVATNIIGNNSQGGTGLTISGGTSDCVFTNISTIGNKGPNASGNQNGVWFADLHDKNNVLSNVNSWDNGDWDLTVFSTDTGNIINNARFSSAVKILNQGHAPMFNVVLDDVLSGGPTSVAMVDSTASGTSGPAHRLFRYFSSAPAGGDLMGQYVFCGSDSNQALVEYAQLYGVIQNYTAGAWAAGIAVQAFQGGVIGTEMNIGSGVSLGAGLSPLGIGTLNAEVVFDNGVALTCYVLEQARLGKIDLEEWRQLGPADRFESIKHLLDPEAYAEFWRTHGHLPSLPSREDWIKKGKHGVGDLVQRLWETVEMQAVMIEKLRQKIEGAS